MSLLIGRLVFKLNVTWGGECFYVVLQRDARYVQCVNIEV
jgi:hypothetical protein